MPILLTGKQITVIGEIFQWEEVENTFMVFRPMGRATKVFFVIGLKTGEVKYFDIGNQLGFKYNGQDFSALIEHFKNKHFAQHGIAKSGA